MSAFSAQQRFSQNSAPPLFTRYIQGRGFFGVYCHVYPDRVAIALLAINPDACAAGELKVIAPETSEKLVILIPDGQATQTNAVFELSQDGRSDRNPI
ncbi:MAG: hypothetical protein AAFY26_02060 [Cyanobacteria bacterium J06638_22]